MAFRDYTVLAWSPSLDARDGKQTFTSAAQAFAAADEYSSVKRNMNARGERVGKPLQVQGDTSGQGLPVGSVSITAMSRDPNVAAQRVTLTSGTSNTNFMVRPFVTPSEITYDYSRNTGPYSVQNVVFDATKASGDDVIYTSTSFDTLSAGVSFVYANYPQYADVLLGGGSDVVVGGPGYDRIYANYSSSKGSKVLIGGSFNDLILGGSDSDYIVGDYHAASSDAFVNLERETSQEGKQRPNPQTGDPRFAVNDALIKSTALDQSLARGSYPNYDFYSRNDRSIKAADGYTYTKGTTDFYNQNLLKSQTSERSIRLGSANSTPIYPNIWQPYGDVILGGAGDDVIFGDDSVWSGQDLIDYKRNFGDTLDAIANWQNYYNLNFPWKTLVDKDQFVDEVVNGKTVKIPARRLISELKTPSWTDTSDPQQRRLRLGDDEIYGGDGDDVIFGGFGSDLIVGGKGFDIINAPALILVPGYDPLWDGATVLYGDEFANKVDSDGLPSEVRTLQEINARRFGNIDSQGKAYTEWRSVLTPNPDVFVFNAPILTESQLQAYSENFGEIQKGLESALVKDRKSNTDKSIDQLLKDKLIDTSLDLAATVPLVGDVIGILTTLYRTWIDWPKPDPVPPTIPNVQDRYRIIRDFDIWDTLIYTTSKNDVISLGSQESYSIQSDAARWYALNGYRTTELNNFDTTVKTYSGNGDSTIILSEFKFTEATKSFIQSMRRAESFLSSGDKNNAVDSLSPVVGTPKIVNINVGNDPVTGAAIYYPLQEIVIGKDKNGIDQSVGDFAYNKPLLANGANDPEDGFFTTGDRVRLSDAIYALSKSWGTDESQHAYADTQGFGDYFVTTISHRLFAKSTLDKLVSLGFNMG